MDEDDTVTVFAVRSRRLARFARSTSPNDLGDILSTITSSGLCMRESSRFQEPTAAARGRLVGHGVGGRPHRSLSRPRFHTVLEFREHDPRPSTTSCLRWKETN